MKKITPFYFDSETLSSRAEELQAQFQKAEPFPHIVIDNFVPEHVLAEIADEFPEPDDDVAWDLWGPGDIKHTKNKNIEKLGTSHEENFGPFTRHFMSQLNSNTFVQFLQKVTGTPHLVVDPSYNGCGLHSTGRGGKLMVHVDLNRYPVRQQADDIVHQRFNLILFINRDWKEEYGGHLELWNRDATRCEKKILPVFNRAVVFQTDSFSYHGHPHPLTCPEGRRRNSLAVYYYEINRKLDSDYRGLVRTVQWVSTTPEDKAAGKNWPYIIRVEGSNLIKGLTPPLLLDGIRAIKRSVTGKRSAK